MSRSFSFALCAVLFFAFCSCNSFAKEGELELKGEPKIAGIEETDADWVEEENVEDTDELPEKDTNEYQTAQDGTIKLAKTSKNG